jgi:hypothetical protein
VKSKMVSREKIVWFMQPLLLRTPTISVMWAQVGGEEREENAQKKAQPNI